MRATKKTTREQQVRSIETRERLLDGAVECLIQRGYSGTTTTALCEISGVSRGGQQHHFPTRELLVITAVEHLTARVIEGIRKGASEISPDQAPVEAVVELLWRGFSGRWLAAAYELWIAARTDASLRAVFIPAEQSAGRAILKLCLDVLPPEVTERDEFLYDLGTAINLMHGLALVQIIRTDAELERFTLNVCRDLLLGRMTEAKKINAADPKRVLVLERENAKLKSLLAEAMLEREMLKETKKKRL